MGRWAATLLQDDFGHRVADPLAMFKPVLLPTPDEDLLDVKVYGFMDHSGLYLLQKQNIPAGTLHYYIGSGNWAYVSDPVNKFNLPYVMYPVVFGL